MNLTAQGEGYSSYELFYQEKSGDTQIDIYVSPQKISVGQVIFSIKITLNLVEIIYKFLQNSCYKYY